MSVQQLERSQYTLIPSKLSRQLQRLTQFDLFVIGLAVVLTAYLSQQFDMIGVLLGLTIGAVVLDQLEYCRAYDYLFIKLPASWYLRWVRKGVNWKQGDAKQPIPYRIMRTPIPGITLVFGRPSEQKVSIVLGGTGSDFLGLGTDAQRGFHLNLADALKRILIRRGYLVQLGWIHRSRDWDEGPQDDFDYKVVEPEILIPPLESDTSPNVQQRQKDHEYHQEVRDKLRELGARSVSMATVLTIRRKGVANLANGIDVEDQENDPVLRTSTSAATQLKLAGIEEIAPLDYTGTCRHFEDAWNLDRANSPNDGIWPREKISTTTEFVTMDGFIHGLIRVTGGPKLATPLTRVQLISTPIPYKTVSVGMEVVRTRVEYAFYGALINFSEDIRSMLGIKRARPKVRRKDEERREREQESGDNTHLLLSSTYIVVSQRNEKDFQRDMSMALEYLERCQQEAVQVVTAEKLLYDLVWKALTGIA